MDLLVVLTLYNLLLKNGESYSGYNNFSSNRNSTTIRLRTELDIISQLVPPFTIESLAKDTYGVDYSGWGTIFGTTGGGSGFWLAIYKASSNDYLTFNIGTSGATYGQYNITEVKKSKDVWKHYAVSYGNDYLKCYVNGVEVKSVSILGSGGVLAGNYLYVGSNNGVGTFNFHGNIDYTRIWKTVRSSGDIYSNMLTEMPSGIDELIHNWKFNEPYGYDRIIDYGSTRNDLIPANSLTITRGSECGIETVLSSGGF